MSDIVSLCGAITGLFGTFVVLAVFVAGFWKGLSWLKKADGVSDGAGPDDDRFAEMQFINLQHGTAVGFGDRGSGLHRGRR